MKKLLLLLLFVPMVTGLWGQQRLVFREDFNENKNAWTLSDNEKALSRIKDGKYKLTHHGASGSYLFLIPSMSISSDFDFEVSSSLTQFQGEETDGFGLVWGAQDAGNFYGFNINAAGQFRVYQYKDFNYSEIKSFTQADTWIKSRGQANVLTIRRTGELLSFFANDHFLYSMPMPEFFGEQGGFVLYNQTEVHADYLWVRQGKGMPEVFEDSFEDNHNGWLTDARDSTISLIKDEKLYLRAEEGLGTTYQLKPRIFDYSKDFEIEANLRQIAGKNNKGYGLMWGAKDGGNGYAFLINSFGSYAVFQRKEGKTTRLIDWEPSDQLLHLRVQPNKLVVQKIGEEYGFFLNDIWLQSIPFQAPMGDQLGFVLTADLKIEVEYLAVREGQRSYTPEPPVITLVSPGNSGVTIDSKALTYKAGINSQSELKGIKLFVNGQQVPGEARPDPSGKFQIVIDKELTLIDGENEIRLHAKNEDGMVQKSTIQVTVKPPHQPIVRNGNDYAVFFATDDYTEWSDLTNPVNDVRTIARELEQNYGFNTELVIGAGRKDILKKLKEYARQTFGENDQLLIFFAGHGKFDEDFGEGYVVGQDSEKDDDGNDSYLAHSSLRTIVNNIPCRHTFLVMDVCFGGTIDPFIAQTGLRGGKGNGNKEMTQTEFIDRKMKFKTRKYLTSGGKEYVPDGTPGQHSPFARKFLEGLRNYGGHDKIITLGELILYFERLLPEPRFGEFGTNEPGSDFLFIAR